MKVIRICAKRNGFRRAGIAHPDTPVEHPIKRFTPEQMERLAHEPMLIVDILDRPDPAGEAAASPAKGRGAKAEAGKAEAAKAEAGKAEAAKAE